MIENYDGCNNSNQGLGNYNYDDRQGFDDDDDDGVCNNSNSGLGN